MCKGVKDKECGVEIALSELNKIINHINKN